MPSKPNLQPLPIDNTRFSHYIAFDDCGTVYGVGYDRDSCKGDARGHHEGHLRGLVIVPATCLAYHHAAFHGSTSLPEEFEYHAEGVSLKADDAMVEEIGARARAAAKALHNAGRDTLMSLGVLA